MKQALLITAYKDFEQLIDLVNVFDTEFNIYVHYDAKNKLSADKLEKIAQLPNVKYITQKYRVNWGGFNHLRAYLLLSSLALDDAENVYFHLITAQDYPVKSLEYFKSWLEQNSKSPKDYLDYTKLPNSNWSQGGKNRLDYYHFYDVFDAKRRIRFIRRLVRLQKKIGFKRRYPKNLLDLYGGSTYWTLTRKTLDYVISYTNFNPTFLNRFKHSFCAEELYFQTVIMNSKLSKHVVNDNLRYIDWSKGRGSTPVNLEEIDFNKCMTGDYLFARKFDSHSNPLKDKINNELLFKN